MFALETAIAQWKESFEANDSVVSDDILELETHLRESIVSLAGGKLNQEEAFLVASHRLGHAPELSDEFAKINIAIAWRKRVFWMLSGYLAFIVSANLVSAFTTLVTLWIAMNRTGDVMSIACTVGASAIAWTTCFAIAYRLSKRMPIGSTRKPIVIAGGSVILSYLLAIGSRIFLFSLVTDGTGVFLWQLLSNNAILYATPGLLGAGSYYAMYACLFFLVMSMLWMLSKPQQEASEITT